ncbi:MAG TPA: hypothetical protein VG826_05130 [Pirellulales bacterium]|nr:hypothetical protein [Pirellulales bacterium]
MGKLTNSCRLLYFAYFSQPAGDRPIYRAIRRQRAKSVLEIGIGSGLRASRMIEAMRRAAGGDGLRYAGIDLFELSPAAGPLKLSLKAAHCKLKPTGAKVRLVPGNPFEALASAANEIGVCDLILVTAGHDPDSLSRAWFYLPRLLHPGTHVYIERGREEGGPSSFELLSHDEIRRLAQAGMPRRTAA